MKRNYDSGIEEQANFFTGIEIEKTPAYGLKTLFVVGHQVFNDIIKYYEYEKCEHIYLGANKSFNPNDWESNIIINGLLSMGLLTTLDFNIKHIEWVLERGYCEYDNFIPQISVEIPYIRQLNYNAVLKIDDIDFKKSNPGVWCHSLHELQNKETFTPWTQYAKDKIIK